MKNPKPRQNCNPGMLERAVRRTIDQGIDTDLVAERYGLHPDTVSRLATTPATRNDDYSCAHCRRELTYHSAIRLGSQDFCSACRRWLFSHYDEASGLYPDLFSMTEDP